ncbi:hypothetical protein T4D_231 [Trichinella pseudospiralis]|uniref:Uncharacterized protein n=1 Tax=Trichinella pseudospiralis TaxID=6337 RepID=A0A0V1DSS4_TRIPS|nr:hypothetical protein T4D_231 [Trichinella pseudospiralis]
MHAIVNSENVSQRCHSPHNALGLFLAEDKF